MLPKSTKREKCNLTYGESLFGNELSPLKAAHNVVRRPGALAFASLALAVWEFHCYAHRIVVSPPGMAEGRGTRSEHAQLPSHWPVLVCHL